MIKIVKKNISKNNSQNGFLSKIKFAESYTGFIFGAIVVLIIGILLITFAKGNRNTQTSSTKDFVDVEKLNLQDSKDSKTSSTYTVRPGDDLWTISENYFDDGYKWVEIAKLNKLENPGLIFVGNKLIIPIIKKQEQAVTNIETSTKTSDSAIKNISITGNSYTVIKGDNLWNIAVRAYGDGFKWVDIAKANNLKNPDLIHRGNVFKIPR